MRSFCSAAAVAAVATLHKERAEWLKEERHKAKLPGKLFVKGIPCEVT